MNKLLAFFAVLLIAIAVIFVLRGRSTETIVSGSVTPENQNLFTPDPDDGSSVVASAKDLPAVTPRGSVVKSRVTTESKPTQVVVQPVNVIETQKKVQVEKTEQKRKLQESVGAESVRRSWKANRVSAATKPKSDKSGGFFMDDDELPPAVAQWEKNKGKTKPGELKFLGRSPNVSEKSVPPAKTGNAQLKFLGRSEN